MAGYPTVSCYGTVHITSNDSNDGSTPPRAEAVRILAVMAACRYSLAE